MLSWTKDLYEDLKVPQVSCPAHVSYMIYDVCITIVYLKELDYIFTIYLSIIDYVPSIVLVLSFLTATAWQIYMHCI